MSRYGSLKRGRAMTWPAGVAQRLQRRRIYRCTSHRSINLHARSVHALCVTSALGKSYPFVLG
jgi:hypothetical protein